ncbi:N-acetyltransferase [Jeotgalibaca caeni]|uniref:N-acetyltransferase n=1 Tax=Jeotgalibaca caeni TaxID=3028623 RepID=UPI00237DA8FF|nr:N-acetyltransferase [Jeotgalibaca caeni]MDE1549107.1 N-acetyltransferase [Jeotgalibaca caeni]
MEIREAREEELDRLIEIWLDASRQSHSFIDSSYWEENVGVMRGLYLPLSQNTVIEDEGEIVGFLSMMGEELAALFIDPRYQQQGYGQQLLRFVQAHQETIALSVYAKNKNALSFYQKHHFLMIEECVDEPTNEIEYRMKWERGEIT